VTAAVLKNTIKQLFYFVKGKIIAGKFVDIRTNFFMEGVRFMLGFNVT